MAVNRREFIQSVLATGASIAATGPNAFAKVRSPLKAEQVNVGLIGCGAEGQELIHAARNIPGINFVATCDIWEYSLRRASGKLRTKTSSPTKFTDYRKLLEKRKELNLHAVIIATPDWMHAEQANAAMEADLHVYCEKEMSNNLEKAASMVHTARRTKRLLQIGHQRRSNPRYIHGIDRLIKEVKLLGRVTHASAQWNRGRAGDITSPRSYQMKSDELAQWGYSSMHELRNWRWYKKFGGGPVVDLGSHQIDLFSWVFGSNPCSVMALGGTDFYTHREWFDNVMCVFEYDTPEGKVRAAYQTLTTSGHGGFGEAFMGENGTLVISEIPMRGNYVEREPTAPKWDVMAKLGLLRPLTIGPAQKKEKKTKKKGQTKNIDVDVRVSPPLPKWPLPIELAKPAHQPHLENFFDAIRDGVPLNCPAEVGYETAVAVLAVNDAVRDRKLIEFKKEQFHA